MLTYYISEGTICITFINVRLNDIIPECLQTEKSVDYQPRAVRLLTVLAVMDVGLAKDDLEVPKIKYENSRCCRGRKQAEWLHHAIYITSSFPGARSFIFVAQKLPGSRVVHSCQIFNCMIYTNRKFFFAEEEEKTLPPLWSYYTLLPSGKNMMSGREKHGRCQMTIIRDAKFKYKSLRIL